MLTPGETASREAAAAIDAILAASTLLVGRGIGGADAAELERICAAEVADGSEEAQLALCRLATRDPRLLELAPSQAFALQLRILVALGLADAASVWVEGPTRRLECLASMGESATRTVREAARRALNDRPGPPRARTIAVAVRRFGIPVAALVVVSSGDHGRASRAAADLAPALSPVFERAAMLREGSERDRILSEAGSRRLTRLGFDLHDGPLQDVAALLADVRLYREQLRRELPAGESREPLLGRVDDFEARLVALVDELRDLAESFEPLGMLNADLSEVIARETDALRRRTGIAALCEVDVDTDALTASQRITIVRLVQEGLANIRDHSGASHAAVTAVHAAGHVRVEISDDGAGFDVDSTLARARRRRRLGLAGMAERVRLLGGEFRLESEPGKGTTLTVILPDWSEGAAPE